MLGELKQNKPFTTASLEAFLNVLRTAEALSRPEMELLKGHGLSPTQYNVLRILRGAGQEGLACREIGQRMVKYDPDVTRLLDRLEARGLLTRDRHQEDRRVIVSRITDAGVALLADLDAPIDDLHAKQLEHLGPEKIQALITLLEEARANLS